MTDSKFMLWTGINIFFFSLSFLNLALVFLSRQPIDESLPVDGLRLQYFSEGKWHFFEEIKMAALNLKANDQLPLSLQAADEFGNPTQANFDSPPTWTSSDTTVAAVVPAADGLSAVVTSPSGKLAGATVQITGQVNGAPIQGSLQLQIVAGDTAEIVVVPGTPTPVQAAAAPAAPAAS